MNTQAAYGVYPHDVALQQVVQTLNRCGFGKEDICMMVAPKHPLATVVRANILQAERGAGAATAEMMAWLMKLGAVMIPGVGLFIRSKAFLETLMTIQDSSTCVRSNGLVRLGFSERDAERFETELGDTGILVYVACPGRAGAMKAAEVLRLTGAYESAALEEALKQELAEGAAV